MPFNTTMPYFMPRGGSPGGSPCVTEVNSGCEMRQCGNNATGAPTNPETGEACIGGPMAFNTFGFCLSEVYASIPTVNR